MCVHTILSKPITVCTHTHGYPHTYIHVHTVAYTQVYAFTVIRIVHTCVCVKRDVRTDFIRKKIEEKFEKKPENVPAWTSDDEFQRA